MERYGFGKARGFIVRILFGKSASQPSPKLMTFATIGKMGVETHMLHMQHALHMASLACVPEAQEVSIYVNRALADC
jgi:hypothetical protein